MGWTVGTLDAEAVMFGHPLSLTEIPKVIGVYLHGKPKHYATSTGKAGLSINFGRSKVILNLNPVFKRNFSTF